MILLYTSSYVLVQSSRFIHLSKDGYRHCQVSSCQFLIKGSHLSEIAAAYYRYLIVSIPSTKTLILKQGISSDTRGLIFKDYWCNISKQKGVASKLIDRKFASIQDEIKNRYQDCNKKFSTHLVQTVQNTNRSILNQYY